MSKTITELKKENGVLEVESFDLIAKVVELIGEIGWNDDDTYTFKDGDRWRRFDPEYELELSTRKKDVKEQY